MSCGWQDMVWYLIRGWVCLLGYVSYGVLKRGSRASVECQDWEMLRLGVQGKMGIKPFLIHY